MTEEEAHAALEAAITDYLVATGSEGFDNTAMMLEGWVLQASGRSIGNFQNETPSTTNVWAMGENQPVYATVGLAEILHRNVRAWYDSGVSIENEDD